MQGRSRTIAVTLLKFAVSGAILAYLLSDIQRKAPDTFRQLVDEPKHWWYLAIALGSHTMALLVGMFRWYLLTVALRFGVGLRSILRIICLAYIVEVLSVGIAGADAARATMLARAVPARAASAIGSVLFDRLLGGYVLLCFVSFNGWVVGPTDPVIQAALRTLQGLTGFATAGLALWIMFPRLAAWMIARVSRFGRVGAFVAQEFATLDDFRDRLPLLCIAFVLTVLVLTLASTTFYLVSHGTPGGGPGWQEHTLIVPLLLLSALVPLPMQGLGVVDYTLGYMYQHSASPAPIGQGFIVAMAMRLIGIIIGGLAALGYALLPPPNKDVSTP